MSFPDHEVRDQHPAGGHPVDDHDPMERAAVDHSPLDSSPLDHSSGDHSLGDRSPEGRSPNDQLKNDQLKNDSSKDVRPSNDRRIAQSVGVFASLQSLLGTVVVAVFVITFVVQAFQIPSSSMENTLLVGDYLLVNKLCYRAGSM